ncbi:MAG: hypothetical protein PHF37_10850, partial [Phycisphaerae bacterium]|nr:hypothetical protein [Phycisphaerae bacterium]
MPLPLVKWLRRNNKKLMAGVVVVIMIGFVLGSYIQKLQYRQRSGATEKVARFDGRFMYAKEVGEAARELEALRAMGAADILRSWPLPMLKTPDMHPLILAELLFGESGTSIEMIAMLNQIVRRNQLAVSEKQIADIYRKTAPNHVYWLLLKNESEKAGVTISPEESAALLANIIPQLRQGATYANFMGAVVSNTGMPEERLLGLFSRLWSVFEYSKMMCSMENVTSPQMRHMASYQYEAMDVNMVEFDSD